MTLPRPLGCIADDLTGAVDVAAGALDAGGSAVILTAPPSGPPDAGADIVIRALKSRMAAAQEAVADSVAAARYLRSLGVRQLYFKYCSTFDSTPAGNIGPVADALLGLVGQRITVVAPGNPAQRRTVQNGWLYVDGVPLAESAMRHHPLTPMTCSDVRQLLQAQSAYRSGVISLDTIRNGPDAVRDQLSVLAGAKARYAVLDAVTAADVAVIAEAAADDALVTGSAALAHELVRRARPVSRPPAPYSGGVGRRAVLSGSCSEATQHQVADFRDRGGHVYMVDPRALADVPQQIDDAVRWARRCPSDAVVLIASTADPGVLSLIQEQCGRDVAARRVERFFRLLAPRLLGCGFGQFIVAGGETSGAVVSGLGVAQMQVRSTIGSGLAWCTSAKPDVALALKSGNFGSPGFFSRAFDHQRSRGKDG